MSSYEVKRSITIDAAPQQVYGKIADLHKWPAWSPWERMDPDMTKRYTGPRRESGLHMHGAGTARSARGR